MMNEKSIWQDVTRGITGTGIPENPQDGTILTCENGDVFGWFKGVWRVLWLAQTQGLVEKEVDPVNNPSHYTRFKGIEVIQLTEQLNFCRGNAVKYIARAGAKDDLKEIEDLEKAVWYIQREIKRIKDNVDE